MRVPTWLALLGFALLLVAVGVFLASQDLGVADQYASIASFFLALVVAGGSAIIWLRARAAGSTGGALAGGTDADAQPPQQPGAADPQQATAAPTSGTAGDRIAKDNEFVQQGDNSIAFVTRTVHQPPSRRRRR
jgi:hypothetical protein